MTSHTFRLPEKEKGNSERKGKKIFSLPLGEIIIAGTKSLRALNNSEMP